MISDLISNDFIAVRSGETLASMFGKMIATKQVDVFVFGSAGTPEDSLSFEAREMKPLSASEYKGMFAYPFLPFRVDTKDMKVQSVTKASPVLRLDDSLQRAVQLFFESQHSSLPVLDAEGKHLLGVVHAFDVLEALERDINLADMKVASIRHPKPAVLAYNAALGEALEMLRSEHVDRLAVVDERGELTGMLSYLDIVENYYVHAIARDEGLPPDSKTKAFTSEPHNLMQLPIENFMSKRAPVTTDENSSAADAVRHMRNEGVLSLLLLDEMRKPTGILTLHDVLHALLSEQTEEGPLVNYKGFSEMHLDEYERDWVRKIIAYYVQKLSYYIDNDYTVNVHFREHSHTGKTHRFEVNVLVDFAGGPVAAEAVEWDLSTAVHQVFGNVEAELQHTFDSDPRHLPSVKKLAAQEGNPNLPGDLAAD